eukprot:gene5973-9694_t
MLALLAASSLVHANPVAPPMRPGPSPFQHQLLSNTAEKAIALSASATEELMHLLSSQYYSQASLDVLREHLAIAEVVHNFNVWSPSGGGGMYDVNLTIASENGYFFNQWELDYLNLAPGRCTNPSEAVVEDIFGFAAFTSSREVVDFGKNAQFPVNCAPWQDQSLALGTVGRLDHTLLTSLRSWNDTAEADALARLLSRAGIRRDGRRDPVDGNLNKQTNNGAVNNITAAEYMRYIEADVAGVASFPGGVQLILASFPALFGTPDGVQLQQWCGIHGADAKTPGMGSNSFEGMLRLLDPVALALTTLNRSFTVPQVQHFNSVWRNAATIRTETGAPPHTALSAADTDALWGALAAGLGPTLTVQPPLVRACAADMVYRSGFNCIGVDVNLDCVCSPLSGQ